MAKRKKPEESKTTPEEDRIQKRKKFLARCVEHERDNRTSWLSDMAFAEGDQWPEAARRAREDPTNPRPIITINNVKQHVLQVINDMRQNRPDIKVRPVSIDASNDTAEVFNGIIRHIEQRSDWETALDVAANGQVGGGWGYFRVLTEVIDEELNLQDIIIAPIFNTMSVYTDSYALSPVGADIKKAMIVVDMDKDSYEDKYGEPDGGWTEVGQGNSDLWVTEDNVRIAEYFELAERTVEVYTLQDGEKITAENYEKAYPDPMDQPFKVNISRKKQKYVKWEKLTGFKILEEGEIPCSYIPIVRVPGYYYDHDGKRIYSGLIKAARDPVMAANLWFSSFTEHVAMAPKGKFMAPVVSTEGFEGEWADANVSNDPLLPYHHVDQNGQPIPAPQRVDPPPPPMGIIQGLQLADNALKSVTGQYEASLGQKGNETSGKAIVARQQEGDTATYHFVDHTARAVKFLGRILIDMIPRIIDTPRAMMIIGQDGKTERAQLSPDQDVAVRETMRSDGTVQKIYNLGVGTYDVMSTVGPTFASRRQEFVQAMTQIMQANPESFQLFGDIFMRANDFPGADEIGERFEMVLPDPIKQAIAAKKQSSFPAAAMMQIQSLQQQMQQMQQQLQLAQTEGQKLQAIVATKQLDIQKQQIELEATQIEAQAKQQELLARAAELQKPSPTSEEVKMMKIQSDSMNVDKELATKQYIAELEAQTEERIAVMKSGIEANIKQWLATLDAHVEAARIDAEQARTEVIKTTQ